MKENKYDDSAFFEKYSQMPRSIKGLDGAGEWHALKSMMPNFRGKRVLDLGCGFGWHCVYAAQQGAASVIGVDISEKMLYEAKNRTSSELVKYIHSPIEDYDYLMNSFDAVISSLAFHYVKSFDDICSKVSRCLVDGGDFVYSVEHPIFTAQGGQDWTYDEEGRILHWPVDRYFSESERASRFLGEDVVKYHRTLSTYVECMLRHGFSIVGLREPTPSEEMMKTVPGMTDELRRPMMLIISARKY